MRKDGLPCATPIICCWHARHNRSLDKGVYKDTVQWDTFCKQMSTITNISQAAVAGLEDLVGAYEWNRMWISNMKLHPF
jgi:hypothetical protein